MLPVYTLVAFYGPLNIACSFILYYLFWMMTDALLLKFLMNWKKGMFLLNLVLFSLWRCEVKPFIPFWNMDLLQSTMSWSPTKLASAIWIVSIHSTHMFCLQIQKEMFYQISIYFVLKALLAIEMKPPPSFRYGLHLRNILLYSGTTHCDTTLLILLFNENLMDKPCGYLYILHSVLSFHCDILLFYFVCKILCMLSSSCANPNAFFSTGKSTLLNHLFYTNFREMDAFRGR